MSQLPPLPKPPEGVKYLLTCSQSVLFTDLLLRGNGPSVYRRVYGIDYTYSYYVYDGGEIRHDFPSNFKRHLSSELKPDKD